MPVKVRPPLALCYHGLDVVPPRRDRSLLFVRPAHLLRHMQVLTEWGYRFVGFGELARRAEEGEATNLAAMTFDDGLVDNLTVLAPLLGSANVPATVFVVAGWLGEAHPAAPWTRIMTADELRSLSDAGIEIGGHSMGHEDLSQLPRDRAEANMHGCRMALESIVDRPVEVFAYPFGRASAETMSACAAAGYRAACRAHGQGAWTEPFNLPRQAMVNGSSRLGLWLKRDDRYEPLMQTAVGRVARRVARLARSAQP